MVEKDRVNKRIEELRGDAIKSGYYLNPDEEMVYNLVEGLLANNDRYDLEICPCRLVLGKPEDNLDIVCPCDYRDIDIAEKGACFCALYLSEDNVKQGGVQIQVPDRRLMQKTREKKMKKTEEALLGDYPLWRCKVCGYLCANEYPPGICPICKAKKERFEKLAIQLNRVDD